MSSRINDSADVSSVDMKIVFYQCHISTSASKEQCRGNTYVKFLGGIRTIIHATCHPPPTILSQCRTVFGTFYQIWTPGLEATEGSPKNWGRFVAYLGIRELQDWYEDRKQHRKWDQTFFYPDRSPCQPVLLWRPQCNRISPKKKWSLDETCDVVIAQKDSFCFYFRFQFNKLKWRKKIEDKMRLTLMTKAMGKRWTCPNGFIEHFFFTLFFLRLFSGCVIKIAQLLNCVRKKKVQRCQWTI